MNDPTFQRLAHQAHAGAQGSALDQLERGLVGSALDAVRRDVAHESLDQLTHKLFVSAGQPPPSAAQAQHQMEEKQERFERLGHIPGDGGARHYAAMARYERYIQLKQEEEEAKSKQWLNAAIHNIDEAVQQQQQEQLLLLQHHQQQHRLQPHFAPLLAPPPGSRLDFGGLSYTHDHPTYANNAAVPLASRGAVVGPSGSSRGAQLLGISHRPQQTAQPPRKQQLQLQRSQPPPLLSNVCKLCQQPPLPGGRLRLARFTDNNQEVTVCHACLELNPTTLQLVVANRRNPQQPTLEESFNRGQQRQVQHRPWAQPLTTASGKPVARLGDLHSERGGLGSLFPPQMKPSEAVARGRKPPPARRKASLDNEEWKPVPGEGHQEGSDDSMLGRPVGRRQPATRRRSQAAKASAEPICIDLLSDEDNPASPPGAAAAAAGPPGRTTRAKAYRSTSEKFKGLKCLFPPGGGPGSVEVTALDLPRLDADEFLNDTVIDFYLKWVQEQLPEETRRRCYFFNTFFFKKLADTTGGTLTPELEKWAADSGIKGAKLQALRNHQKVKKWTKDVDLFSKDFVFVPVHEALHWSLMVVCHPGHLMPPKGVGTKSSTARRIKPGQKTPCILHLDSLSGSHNAGKLGNLLRLYLSFEWHFKSQAEAPADTVPRKWALAHPGEQRSFMHDEFPYKPVTLPKQDNHCDCGLFVCSFAEFFAASLPSALCSEDLKQLQHYGSTNRDLFEGTEHYYPGLLTDRWFPNSNPSKLRWEIRRLVLEMMADQSGLRTMERAEDGSTGEEQWVEGQLAQDVQEELMGLREKLVMDPYLRPEEWRPSGEEQKQKRREALERKAREEAERKASRGARQTKAAKDLGQASATPNRELHARAAEQRLGSRPGGGAEALFDGLKETLNQDESEGLEDLPRAHAQQQLQQEQQEEGCVMLSDEEQVFPGDSPDLGVSVPARGGELSDGDLPSPPLNRKRGRKRRRVMGGSEEEEEAEEEEEEMAAAAAAAAAGQHSALDAPAGPQQQLEDDGPPNSKRRHSKQPQQQPQQQQLQQEQQAAADPAAGVTSNQDSLADLKALGYPAAGVAPPPPPPQQKLDWERVARVVAVLDPPDPPGGLPNLHQHVELRVWYRGTDPTSPHNASMEFAADDTGANVKAMRAWQMRHEDQLWRDEPPLDWNCRQIDAWEAVVGLQAVVSPRCHNTPPIVLHSRPLQRSRRQVSGAAGVEARPAAQPAAEQALHPHDKSAAQSEDELLGTEVIEVMEDGDDEVEGSPRGGAPQPLTQARGGSGGGREYCGSFALPSSAPASPVAAAAALAGPGSGQMAHALDAMHQRGTAPQSQRRQQQKQQQPQQQPPQQQPPPPPPPQQPGKAALAAEVLQTQLAAQQHDGGRGNPWVRLTPAALQQQQWQQGADPAPAAAGAPACGSGKGPRKSVPRKVPHGGLEWSAEQCQESPALPIQAQTQHEQQQQQQQQHQHQHQQHQQHQQPSPQLLGQPMAVDSRYTAGNLQQRRSAMLPSQDLKACAAMVADEAVKAAALAAGMRTAAAAQGHVQGISSKQVRVASDNMKASMAHLQQGKQGKHKTQGKQQQQQQQFKRQRQQTQVKAEVDLTGDD